MGDLDGLDWDWEKYEDEGPDIFNEELAFAWASKKREENKSVFDIEDYRKAVTAAHPAIYLHAEGEIIKAENFFQNNEYAASVFHASRAVEGYVRAVYLRPLAEVMLNGIAAGFKKTPEFIRKILPSQIKNSHMWLEIGLAVFLEDEKEIKVHRNRICDVFDPSKTPWRIRNTVVHTLNEVVRDDANALVQHAKNSLPLIAETVIGAISKREETENVFRCAPLLVGDDFW